MDRLILDKSKIYMFASSENARTTIKEVEKDEDSSPEFGEDDEVKRLEVFLQLDYRKS